MRLLTIGGGEKRQRRLCRAVSVGDAPVRDDRPRGIPANAEKLLHFPFSFSLFVCVYTDVLRVEQKRGKILIA